jgi:two-component sensor histidine kinase
VAGTFFTRVSDRAPPAARWPTGAKLLVTLSVALLPLALIAILATLQTVRIFDSDNRARLRVASSESSHALAIELTGDMNALRSAAKALEVDAQDAPSCARVRGVFSGQGASGARFAITDRRNRMICGDRFAGMPRAVGRADSAAVVASIRDDGVVVGIPFTRRSVVHASAFFPTGMLATISRPSGLAPEYGTTIVADGDRLALARLAPTSGLDRRETMTTALGIADLTLEMQVRSAPITWPLILALLLPILMWAAAAGIGWFVVDRLLIRPLRQLRGRVATYHPGDVIDPGATGSLPAQEIRELGDTFRAISRTVALHEAGLAEGLVRQARLTREVHHRVKNNLQVISSLINIHARGARGADASAAYSSIQRRVDALAVVHRNHFAEAEANRGLSLRSILGELASNIRATAPETSTGLGIALDVQPVLVNQDVAVAAAFIVTETVELAMTVDPVAQIRITVRDNLADGRARLGVSSLALMESASLRDALGQRYGRVMEGLARQLRAPLVHDAVTGAYEISIAITGVD